MHGSGTSRDGGDGGEDVDDDMGDMQGGHG
jgi:hypothetical protein